MKPLFKITCIAAVIVAAALDFSIAQEADLTNEVANTIRDYLAAMSSRDAVRLRSLMEKRLAVIEADRTNAKIGFIDTSNERELLPPAGNDDWDKDKIKLSSIKSEVSATHPSVAMASFTLTFPLSDERVADIEAALKQMPAEFDEKASKAAQKMIADRAIHNAMFAMLARQSNQWKIVCMSFPK